MLTPTQIVENALTVLYNPHSTPVSKAQANETIMKWSENPNCIKEAVDLISTSGKDNIIFACCNVTKDNIIHNYMKFNEDAWRTVRNYMCEKLIHYQGKLYIKMKIIELVVIIALKDWPEKWPECIDDFLSAAQTSPEMCILVFQILSQLIVEIHTATTITETRRKQLIFEFDKYAPALMAIIDGSLATVDFNDICSPVIKLLKELCLTAPYSSLEQFMPTMLPAIFNVFAKNPLSTEDSISTLTNLFINRSDAHSITSQLLPAIVEQFAQLSTDESTPSELTVFIMHFLIVYGTDVDDLCFDGETMIEDVFAQVIVIYQNFIIHSPTTEDCEEYWQLWRCVLQRYYRSSRSKNPFEILKPCYQIFKPLIPDIRQSLYIGFESASEDGKLKHINSQVCWIYVASVDKPGMIDFLCNQQPSVSLCYAIGLIDACLSGKEERDLVIKLFPKLIEHNQKIQNIPFGASLMYAISHIIRFMNKEAVFLNAFSTCLLDFLLSDNASIQTPAVNAIFYVAMRQPKLLARNEDSIIDRVCSSVLGDINLWELKCAVKLVKAIALVGSSQPTAESRALVYSRLLETLAAFLTSCDVEIISKGFIVITKLTKIQFVDSFLIYGPLYEALTVLLSQCIEAQNDMTSTIIETTVDVLLADSSPGTINNIQTFSTALLQLKDNRDAALLALARLRCKYALLESLYPQILQQLLESGEVLFHLAQHKEEAYPILRFFRYFDIHQELVDLIVEVTTHFIQDKRRDVSEEAMKVLKNHIDFVTDQENQQNQEANLTLLLESRLNIIKAAFICLTDTFHAELFKPNAKLLDSFYKAISITSSVLPPDQFDGEVSQIIADILPQFNSKNNPAGMEILVNFSRALRGHMADFNSFSSDLKEFLVSANCASPADVQLFKNGLALDSLEEELMNLVASEERSALIAENELDALEPYLKSFTIE